MKTKSTAHQVFILVHTNTCFTSNSLSTIGFH